MSNIKKGKFIVFEGIDGSGKGTQIDLLVKEIKRQGGSVVQTAEPTNTSTGGMLRDALGGFVRRDAYELSAMFLTDRIFHNVNPINGIMQYLEKGFDKFVKDNEQDLGKCECLIQDVMFNQIADEGAKVLVEPTQAVWHGVTYKEDKPSVTQAIEELVENGEYPQNLWEEKTKIDVLPQKNTLNDCPEQ